MNLTHKIIQSHLKSGEMKPGEEIEIQIDQTLCQDATGTMVMLELEAMDLKRTKAEVSVQYVDHNLIQEDSRNPDDHLFLKSAAERFGLYYSRPGNGISHVLHMQNFGEPGKTLTGSDSHSCAAGSLGMLAIGSGGVEVAMAIAGYPLFIKMPKVLGVEVTGELPDFVSAKDVILEMLKRYDVKGCVGYVIEYFGEGLKNLNAMDRHVIANMGQELGATTSVFPSDEMTKTFLKSVGRESVYKPLHADENATYDKLDHIDLSQVEPMIAKPSSPGNVVKVADIAGDDIYQSYIGSSANPSYRDYAIAASMMKDKTVAAGVSFDINPSSRTILEELVRDGHLGQLIHSGARIHQAGCNGCIGMGQAPATNQNSLRTTPRNFPGRSGTKEDKVFLCSPETATASAILGKITDPRTLDIDYPAVSTPEKRVVNTDMFQKPLPLEKAEGVQLVKGPNVVSLPSFDELPDSFKIPVLLKVGDDVSTDEISPAGAKVLPYRSNIPKISEFTYYQVDEEYATRAKSHEQGHVIIAGHNYGQGSSREHAALAPRYLGLRVVVAKSYARIHWQNLINFGILPLEFLNPEDYDDIKASDIVTIQNIHEQLERDDMIVGVGQREIKVKQTLSARQIDVLKQGGVINWIKKNLD